MDAWEGQQAYIVRLVEGSIAAQAQVGAEEVEQVGAVLREGVEPVGDVHALEHDGRRVALGEGGFVEGQLLGLADAHPVLPG